jgi:hypothetical protein
MTGRDEAPVALISWRPAQSKDRGLKVHGAVKEFSTTCHQGAASYGDL